MKFCTKFRFSASNSQRDFALRVYSWKDNAIYFTTVRQERPANLNIFRASCGLASRQAFQEGRAGGRTARIFTHKSEYSKMNHARAVSGNSFVRPGGVVEKDHLYFFSIFTPDKYFAESNEKCMSLFDLFHVPSPFPPPLSLPLCLTSRQTYASR